MNSFEWAVYDAFVEGGGRKTPNASDYSKISMTINRELIRGELESVKAQWKSLWDAHYSQE